MASIADIQSYDASEAQFAWVESNAREHGLSPEELFLMAEERAGWDLGYPVACCMEESSPAYFEEYDYTLDGRCMVIAVGELGDDPVAVDYSLKARTRLKQ